MAELSDADKRAIFGADYQAPVASAASLEEQRVAKRTGLRNTAIGIAVVVLIIILASVFRT